MSNSKEGFLYVMRNPHLPGIYKIGKTKNPASRRKSLSATSLPEAYECLLSYAVRDKDRAESLAFSMLHDFRYANNKEFFFADIAQITCICGQVQRHINLGVPLESSGITHEQIDKLTDRFSYHGDE